jgi:hypothetical protein
LDFEILCTRFDYGAHNERRGARPRLRAMSVFRSSFFKFDQDEFSLDALRRGQQALPFGVRRPATKHSMLLKMRCVTPSAGGHDENSRCENSSRVVRRGIDDALQDFHCIDGTDSFASLPL